MAQLTPALPHTPEGDRPPQPVRVDFIGPSGVGKTTLCRAVIAAIAGAPAGATPGGIAWLEMDDAIAKAREAARRSAAPALRGHRRLVRFVHLVSHAFRHQLLRGEDLLPASLKLEDLRRDHLSRLLASHGAFTANHLRSAMLRPWRHPAGRARRHYVHLSMMENWALAGAFLGRTGILAHDLRLSLLHDALLWFSSPAEEVFRAFCRSDLAPAGVIHLHTGSPELVLGRARGRERAGVLTKPYVGLPDEDVLRAVAADLATNARAVDLLGEEGVPVLTVSAAPPPEESAPAVLPFLAAVAERSSGSMRPVEPPPVLQATG